MLASGLALVLAIAAPSAQAQTPGEHIGFVDMKRLVDNAPQMEDSRRKLEAEFSARDATLKADETRLGERRATYARDGATLPKDKADAMKREIDALERSIKRNRDNLRNELKTRSDQELDQSWREINNVVVEFARDAGFDLIVQSPVIYASPRIDITDQVLERLKRQHQPGTAGQ
ncbi:MAG: OmpH family outer membrane protein [Dokdonella sp.]